MGKEKKSIADKVFAKVSKQVKANANKESKKHAKLVAAVTDACKAFDLEYRQSGKTTLVVYKDRKIGVINSKLQASAVHDEKVGYVNVTVAEFRDWTEAIIAMIDEQDS